MSTTWGHLIGVFIVIMMISFIGTWIWAWARYHKPVFDRMARLPMQDDPDPPASTDKSGTSQGEKS
jgi:cytochrome c oxidase cbb3-type subunit 4